MVCIYQKVPYKLVRNTVHCSRVNINADAETEIFTIHTYHNFVFLVVSDISVKYYYVENKSDGRRIFLIAFIIVSDLRSLRRHWGTMRKFFKSQLFSFSPPFSSSSPVINLSVWDTSRHPDVTFYKPFNLNNLLIAHLLHSCGLQRHQDC